MGQIQIEHHPLQPFLPKNAKVLILGSFPPPKKRWKMDFYYPNFQNDMWRIFGLGFFNNKDHFVDLPNKTFREGLIRKFLEEKGIAIFDAAASVIRHEGNASDKHLEVIEVIDLENILSQIPACQSIITTGEKATHTLMSNFEDIEPPKINHVTSVVFHHRRLNLYRLPSSSRAYPLGLEQKANVYAQCFNLIFSE